MGIYLDMLFGGYAFIVLSYAFVWVFARGMSRCVSGERMDRFTQADMRAVAGMVALWTIALAAIAIIESCR